MNKNKIPDQQERYNNSPIATMLTEAGLKGRPLRLAFIDIDDTLTGDREAARSVRKLLQKNGIPLILITSRTEELVMSSPAFNKTFTANSPNGIARLRPQLGHKNGLRLYAPIEKHIPRSLLDPEIIVSATGTKIYVRQMDGSYKPDLSFSRKLGNESSWRQGALKALDLLCTQGYKFTLASLEHPDAYEEGKIDVAPPEFRIQISFSSIQAKLQFADALAQESKTLRTVDDSNPESKKYQAYIMPKRGGKAAAAEHVISSLTQASGIPVSELQLFIGGDSYQDLEMGFTAGSKCRALFVLAGGSRLYNYFRNAKLKHFAGSEIDSYRQLLTPLGHGQYAISTKKKNAPRLMLLGEEAFPGTFGPQTIVAGLKQFLSQ